MRQPVDALVPDRWRSYGACGWLGTLLVLVGACSHSHGVETDSGVDVDAGLVGPCSRSEAVQIIRNPDAIFQNLSLEASPDGYFLAASVHTTAADRGAMYMLGLDGEVVGALENDGVVEATVSQSANNAPRFYYHTTAGECYAAASLDPGMQTLVTGERAAECGSGRWASSDNGSIVATGVTADGAKLVVTSRTGEEQTYFLPGLFISDTFAHATAGFAVAAIGGVDAGVWETSFGSPPAQTVPAPGSLQLRLGGEGELWEFSGSGSDAASVTMMAGSTELGRLDFRGIILSKDATRGRLAAATWWDLDGAAPRVSVFGYDGSALWRAEVNTWAPPGSDSGEGVGIASNGTDVLVVWARGHELWARSLRCSR